MHYILDDNGTPVLENDLITWARWFEDANNRRVAYDELPDGITVSTVFLGLDHNFTGGTPILYETMIFGGRCDEEQERYATRDEALAGHARMLALAKEEE